jgi:hypothetical protein
MTGPFIATVSLDEYCRRYDVPEGAAQRSLSRAVEKVRIALFGADARSTQEDMTQWQNSMPHTSTIY